MCIVAAIVCLFVGATLGVFVASLCRVAGQLADAEEVVPSSPINHKEQEMSFEDVVTQHTAALNAHTAAILQSIGKTALQAAAAPAGKAATAAKAADAATTAVVFPDYTKVVFPKVNEAVKKIGREPTVAILASFTSAEGKPATNGKEVQPKDYAALVAACDAAIAAKTTEAPSLV